jgi:uncharacterized protein YjbJ (UPF0337 family)
MDWKIFEGRWNEFKGKVKQKWGKLTDDDITVIAGKKDVLVGKLEQLYGKTRDELEREVDSFASKDCGCGKRDDSRSARL